MNTSDRRTVGIIAVILTTLLCACPGLVLLFTGGLTSLVAFIPGAEIDMMGRNDPQAAFGSGIVMICLSVLLIAIPVVVAIFAFRKRPEQPGRAVVDPAPAPTPYTPPPPPEVIMPVPPVPEPAPEPTSAPGPETETISPADVASGEVQADQQAEEGEDEEQLPPAI